MPADFQKLRERFDRDAFLSKNEDWEQLCRLAEAKKGFAEALDFMENSGGEPGFWRFRDGRLALVDLAPQMKGRESLCYDEEALASRKKNKPAGSARGLALKYGADLLSAEDYLEIQERRSLDEKGQVWLRTPEAMRRLGGSLFGDRRYGRCFIYHNGAESYYAGRSFRAIFLIQA